MDGRTQPPDAPSEGAIRKAVAAAGMGNAVEWFDFALYSYLATTLEDVFFPNATGGVKALSVWGIFAVSFLIRPVGSIVLGPLGDRIGRKAVLAITIVAMSGATLAVGLIPSYASIGVWAPLLLVLCRLVQGFSTGGEYAGAATFMAEYAPNRRRGFLGSFLEFGTYVGYALGAILVLVLTLTLSDASMSSWGWRIPFLIAAPLGITGLYLRSRLNDTPEFAQANERGEMRTPFVKLLAGNWRRLLMLVGIVILLNIGYYIMLTYIPNYLTTVVKVGDVESQVITIGIYIGMMILIAPIGKLSDRFGRRPMLKIACGGFFLLSVPAFLAINTKTAVGMIVGLAVMALLLLPLAATIPATLPALFPTRVRYGAFAIGYNVSTSLFGGTAPLIAAALIHQTGSPLIPGFYLMVAAVVAAPAIMAMPETRDISMRDAGTAREKPTPKDAVAVA